MFTHPVYIKIWRNKVEITDLKDGVIIQRQSAIPFSSRRNIVGDFNLLADFIEDILRELGLRKRHISPSLKIFIQQMEGFEDGLSDIEHRALNDLAVCVGAKYVLVYTDNIALSIEEILLKLKKMK